MRKPSLRAVMERGARTPKPPERPLPEEAEEALALRFVDLHGTDFRYVDVWRRWLHWDGCHWREDTTRLVVDLIRDVCRKAASSLTRKLAVSITRSSTVSGVERLAKSDRRIAATPDQFDSSPLLLNTPGGTVDLSTGRLRAHQRKDYLTKMTSVTPGGDCDAWRKFLHRVTGGDQDLQLYLQVAMGYCLTGSTRENVFYFVYGTGANGKTVFLATISTLLGDYAKNAPIETFLESRTDRHPTELAMLRGARLVSATETEEGKRWNEALIKRITGGERVTARMMRQDFSEFTPELKLVITGNHRPALRTVDEAIRRRIRLIPFEVTIPLEERDKQLPEKLKQEWPGILGWLVEGTVLWSQGGLPECSAITRATEEYLSAEDLFQRWIDERCVRDGEATIMTGELFADWKRWCSDSEEHPGNMRRFSQRLQERGFKRWQHPTLRRAGFRGLALVNQSNTAGGDA